METSRFRNEVVYENKEGLCCSSRRLIGHQEAVGRRPDLSLVARTFVAELRTRRAFGFSDQANPGPSRPQHPPTLPRGPSFSREDQRRRPADRSTCYAARHHQRWRRGPRPVSYTHLRAHETDSYLVCRLLLEKKKNKY